MFNVKHDVTRFYRTADLKDKARFHLRIISRDIPFQIPKEHIGYVNIFGNQIGYVTGAYLKSTSVEMIKDSTVEEAFNAIQDNEPRGYKSTAKKIKVEIPPRMTELVIVGVETTDKCRYIQLAESVGSKVKACIWTPQVFNALSFTNIADLLQDLGFSIVRDLSTEADIERSLDSVSAALGSKSLIGKRVQCVLTDRKISRTDISLLWVNEVKSSYTAPKLVVAG